MNSNSRKIQNDYIWFIPFKIPFAWLGLAPITEDRKINLAATGGTMPNYVILITSGGMTADAAVSGIRAIDMDESIGTISSETNILYNRLN